jgi:hypothetical protein
MSLFEEIEALENECDEELNNMIIKICPNHKQKIAMSFETCPHYPEDDCECISVDETMGYWTCKKCFEISEKKRNAEIKKTCNYAVRMAEVIVSDNKVVSFHPLYHVYFLPHGGTHVRKGSFAQIDCDTGYLKKCKKEEAEFFVIK